MSWNNTVYCGYCGGKGHNIRGCAGRKEDDKITLKERPDSYRADAIRSRQKYEAHQKKLRRPKQCTYCRHSGHNRRGCLTRKGDEVLILNRQRSYRESFATAMKESGFGIGALVKYEASRYGSRTGRAIVGLVTDINWNAVSHKYSDVTISDWRALEPHEQKIASIRIVSVIDSESGAEERGTTPGTLTPLPVFHLVGAFPDLFEESHKANSDRVQYESAFVPLSFEIIGPAPVVAIPGGFINAELTKGVKATYNLENQDKERKHRLHIGAGLWKKVRPEEYQDGAFLENDRG